jgi:hypothetical protein
MLIKGEKDIIFDRFGAAKLRILDNNRIITFDGNHVGILRENLVYNYSGTHVAWYERGILRDLNGHTVGFGINPTDVPRPFLPFRQFLPFRGFVAFPPFPPFPGWPNMRPIKSFGWSTLDPESIFRSR